MKMPVGILVLLLGLVSTVGAYPGEVLASFELPGTCPTGLTFDGEKLWVADRKSDRLYCISPEKGTVERELDAPGYWPMGLAWDGEYLWCADRDARAIYQLNPVNGEILRTLAAPVSSPRGLTWDGRYLWCSDERSDEIVQFSSGDGTTIRAFGAPAGDPRGLGFDGQYLWVSDRIKDEIYRVDPVSGDVIIITEAPGPFTRGLAVGNNQLWAVDYQTDRLYQLVLKDDEQYLRKNAREATILFTHQVHNYGPNDVTSLEVHLAIPHERDNQELHGEITYAPRYDEIITDRWGQKTACFRTRKLKNNKSFVIEAKTRATIYEVRYFIDPDRVGSLEQIPAEITAVYLEDNEKYQLDHPTIKAAMKKCVGGEDNPYWIARKIFSYLIENMYYERVGGWNTAPTVLERGNGSCSEYSFVYIALCRAAGLPARYVGSVVVRGDDASMDNVFHRWVEVYLPNYGWIPVDPSGGDNESPRDQADYFGHLSNRFLITTEGGGGSKTMEWTYNSNEFWTTEPQTKVEIEAIAEWEPVE